MKWLLAGIFALGLSTSAFAAPEEPQAPVAAEVSSSAGDVASALIPAVEEALGTGEAAKSPDEEASSAVRLVVLITTMSILPALLLVMTPFTRFVVVFAMLRQALGLQQTPPNQVLVGLSLMLSLVVMRPTIDQIDREALQPYLNGEIATQEFVDRALVPLRGHMLRNVQREDLATAMRISKIEKPQTLDDVPTTAVVTAYVLEELRSAFVIGVKVYLPFLVVDLVVASVLLGMGMMMTPPVVISLPFKLLVFVLMDGWNLLLVGLAGSVHS